MKLMLLKKLSRGFSTWMIFALLLSPGMSSSVLAAPGDLTRVSVDSSGLQANGSSRHDEISGDGRFVVFESDATNLAGGTGGLFLKDRQTGGVTRVGVAGSNPSISNDGRFIAFDSGTTTEVVGDTNGASDVFMFDRQSGTVSRISVDSSGGQSNANSTGTAISGDGRYVAFMSEATNLVGGDTNNAGDVFVHDNQTGQTRRVSVASNGSEANASAGAMDISADGRFVAFSSAATNLVTGDTNGKADIFVYDLQTGNTTRVSVNTSGAQADGGGFDPTISGDGRYVVFMSDSGNLDPRADEYRGKDLVYVHDRQIGQTTLASVASDGSILTVGLFDQPTISNNGRYVAFSFYDKGNNNGILHIWARDLQTGESKSVEGGDASSGSSSLSSDGKFVAFSSSASNLISGDTNGASDIFVREVAYGTERNPTVAAVAPECGFSTPVCTYPTQTNVSFSVLFSEPVTGVTADDFTLDMLEGITGASITGVGGFGVQYIVTVNTGTGDGRLRLNVVDNDNIVDTALNPLGGVGAGNGNFSKFAGFLYVIDKNSPAVTNIVRADPNPTIAAELHFTVSFSELVYPVSISDFVLSTTGDISGATITAINPREDQFDPAAIYTVTVNTGSGDGTLRLDLIDDDSIQDNNLGNPLGGTGIGNGSFTTGEAYTINKSAPLVTSSLRVGANPTEASSVNFTVSFSEAVTGVDPSDFFLTTTGGISGVLVTNVSGSGNTYTVTVNTGSGSGGIRLDVVDDDSILNASNFPLGGAGVGNGNFTSGEAYAIERNMPTVNSIARMDVNPSSAQSVNFRVTFSEPISGVGIDDFVFTQTGISGASLIAVNGSGNTYVVTVGTGSGNGTLRLDLIDNDSILDSSNNPLGGAGAGNGNFTTGGTYTINKATVIYSTETLRSGGANDGWVLESNENSNVGGSVNATAQTFRLGDTFQDTQYRAILHFPTEALPDNAVVTSVILIIKRQGVAGTNPFTTHQNIQIDITKGYFGFDSYLGSQALQASDFQAPSTLNAVGMIQNNPVEDVYWSLLNGDANRFINLKGVTQLRLSFQLDDNDDLGADYISFFSGDADQLSDRPRLQIEYYVTR
jgi:Tol biopolymer transport system component